MKSTEGEPEEYSQSISGIIMRHPIVKREA